tara:strand:- start:63 stop:188 length:126 start_codon:yes stop_codon:yes gene_type:complete
MIFPVDATSLTGMSNDHMTNEPYVMFQQDEADFIGVIWLKK